MKSFISVVLMVLVSATAMAEDHRDLSSETSKVSKSQQIREYAQNCFNQEMALFETVKGRMPSDDEADLIIDACVNPKLK